ncbi:hypothetical protein B0H19DRAFT_1379243 [Mycena capillaripes]|nr:hypothetical protein B0H19DRAFT_1379243 [Mycena capillaripes]
MRKESPNYPTFTTAILAQKNRIVLSRAGRRDIAAYSNAPVLIVPLPVLAINNAPATPTVPSAQGGAASGALPTVNGAVPILSRSFAWAKKILPLLKLEHRS